MSKYILLLLSLTFHQVQRALCVELKIHSEIDGYLITETTIVNKSDQCFYLPKFSIPSSENLFSNFFEYTKKDSVGDLISQPNYAFSNNLKSKLHRVIRELNKPLTNCLVKSKNTVFNVLINIDSIHALSRAFSVSNKRIFYMDLIKEFYPDILLLNPNEKIKMYCIVSKKNLYALRFNYPNIKRHRNYIEYFFEKKASLKEEYMKTYELETDFKVVETLLRDSFNSFEKDLFNQYRLIKELISNKVVVD
jgi:hypothetical protein